MTGPSLQRIPAPTGSSATDQENLARTLGYQYDLGSTATRRMLDLNASHAELAWRRRRRDPIAAYALSLLFAQTRPGVNRSTEQRHGAGSFGRVEVTYGDDYTGRVEVKAATRIWIAGPENQDLAEMLYRLECYVNDNHDADGWALREQLTTSIDDGLTTDAVWVGVAVSSLDTPTGTWAQTGDLAINEAQVPGTIRLALNIAAPTAKPEHLWIVAERRGIGDYNTVTTHSTHRLSDSGLSAPFRYGITTPTDLASNAWHAGTLQRIYGLDMALGATDHFAKPKGHPAKGSLWRQHTGQPHPRRPA